MAIRQTCENFEFVTWLVAEEGGGRQVFIQLILVKPEWTSTTDAQSANSKPAQESGTNHNGYRLNGELVDMTGELAGLLISSTAPRRPTAHRVDS